jgi:hypothetical protein
MFQKVLLKCLCIALCGIFSTLASAKPLSPVQVSITPSKAYSPGQPVEFVVRATVTMDTERVRVLVSVPATLNVLSGELQWQGPLLKGQQQLLRFTVSLAEDATPFETDPLIQVQAAVISGLQGNALAQSHGRLAASASYLWQTGVARAAASRQALPLNSRVAERNGITIQEYELRP